VAHSESSVTIADTDYLLAENGQVFKINNGVTELLIAELIENTPVSITRLMLDSKNKLWIATESHGLFRYSSTGLESFSHLPNNRLSSIVEDEDGAIWVGTSGGLCMLKIGAVRSIGIQQGLRNENIHTVAVDINDKVYAIPYGKISNLTYIEHYEIKNTKITLSENIDNDIIHGIANDEKGELWIATESKIAKLTNNEIETHIELQAGTQRFLVANDVFWYQEKNKLIKYENKVKSIIPLGQETEIDIRAMSFAVNGDVLIAEKKKAYRITENNARELAIPLDVTSCIHEFVEGEIWVCSGGLWLRKGHSNYYFGKDEGLTNVINGHIHDVINDKYGNIWAVSNSGLFRILRQDIDDLISGKVRTPKFVKFSEKDGMKSSEFNGSSSTAVSTKDGKLWFASQGGVVEVDPDLTLYNSQKVLKPFIEHLFIGDDLISLSQWGEIAANPKTIHMHFGAVFLSEAKNISYRYKLFPYYKNWQTGDSAHFPELEPGNYQLFVQARFYQNKWSDSLMKTMTVLPAWYQTPVFRTMAILLIILIIFGFPLWRIHRLKQNRKELKQLVATQTQSLLLANKRLDMLSRIDELTGIANRRELMNKMEVLCKNPDHKVCLALIDIDDFKAYNDYYGHIGGDDCLVKVARLLNIFSSEQCLVARFGGEEFVMLFDCSDINTALDIVTKMYESIKESAILHAKSSVSEFISLSAGLVVRKNAEPVEKIIDRADVAMYKAKSNGKNKMVIGEDSK